MSSPYLSITNYEKSRPISRTHSIYAQKTIVALVFALKELQTKTNSYFFLYPLGHFGFTAVTFLVNLPFRQVIVDFFLVAARAAALTSASCLAFSSAAALSAHALHACATFIPFSLPMDCFR